MEGAPYGIDPDVMDTYVKSCGKMCSTLSALVRSILAYVRIYTIANSAKLPYGLYRLTC